LKIELASQKSNEDVSDWLTNRICWTSVARTYPITSVETIENEIRSSLDENRIRILRMTTSPVENDLTEAIQYSHELYQIYGSPKEAREAKETLWNELRESLDVKRKMESDQEIKNQKPRHSLVPVL